MKSFNYIESALILSIKDPSDLNKLSFSPKDFSIHGDVFAFFQEYSLSNNKIPPPSLLQEKFSELDKEATGVALEFCVDEFKQQIMFRKILHAFKDNETTLKEDPRKALLNITGKLNDIGIAYDSDVSLYDNGSTDRFDSYLKRKEQRHVGLKIIGIPTAFRSMNKTGVGWLPGEMCTMFARPETGKTWIAIKIAAVARKYGFRILFITTEMPTAQINLRLDVVAGRMDGFNFSHRGLRRGELTDDEEKSYLAYLASNNGKKLFTCDHIAQESLSLQGIRKLVKKHRPDVVVLDGLHLVSNNRGGAIWEKMHDLFYGMKTLCISENVAGIVTTQASRNASDIFAAPKASEVSFGDAAFQASDILMSIYKVEDSDYTRMIEFQKYRDDEKPVNRILLDWDVNIGVIQESKYVGDNQLAGASTRAD